MDDDERSAIISRVGRVVKSVLISTITQGKENRIPRRYFYRPPNVSRWCIEVPRFSPEEAKEAYQEYQAKYGFLPERYEALSRSLRERLREPLLLLLASRLFQNEDIQEDVVASDLEVIPAYTDQILEGIPAR